MPKARSHKISKLGHIFICKIKQLRISDRFLRGKKPKSINLASNNLNRSLLRFIDEITESRRTYLKFQGRKIPF